MKKQEFEIVVTGDVSVNTLIWGLSSQDHGKLDWQNNISLHSVSKWWGALLLAAMIRLATKKKVITVLEPEEKEFPTKGFLNSFIEIHPVALSDEGEERLVYRMKRFMGVSGPKEQDPVLLSIENDSTDASIIVINDENNGFNNNSKYWPVAIKNLKNMPIIIYKMDNPVGENLLWKYLFKQGDDKTIVVISADKLRSKGVNISKSISWEKTALDFVWQLNNNPELIFLSMCKHVIVLFGMEGAIYYENKNTPQYNLYFFPYEFEGDFAYKNIGEMDGLLHAFTAGLTVVFSKTETEEEFSTLIDQGIREGMNALRKYFYFGFGKDPDKEIFPNPLIFESDLMDDNISNYIETAKIPNVLNKEYQDSWCILQGKGSASIAQMAFDLVKNGEENVLMRMPTAKFGKLKTINRVEIESYRTIHNLIAEYISSKNTARPLSIAIFGTPGSGKSYGLSEMATSTFSENIQKISYNLSQFSTALELQVAFHKISDVNLIGKMPFVVFDEFDSWFEDELGWLKYFLSPMQDGLYKGEGTFHPLGKAIFVFVGGTSSCFSEFCGENIESVDEREVFLKQFKVHKGPDFISRLRGYINILGPNQCNKDDHLFMIRRAMLMRSLIEQKLPHLINKKGEAQIDNGVLRAMLKVPKYKHESRSLEAIMDMSILTQATKWEQSFLPPKEQLKLHLDEKLFLRYMMHDAIFSEKIELIASLLRSRFHSLKDSVPIYGDDVSFNWEGLGEEQKNFYKLHVRNIPAALLLIQYDVLYVDDKIKNAAFTGEELAQLVDFEYTHRRDYERIHHFSSAQIVPKEIMKKQIYQMISLWTICLEEENFKLEGLNSNFYQGEESS